jgi:hypothetical protein
MITVRQGEKPLLPMDGTGDATKLWLFDPKQDAFFCFELARQCVPTELYRRNGKAWETYSYERGGKLEQVTRPDTVKLLDEMNEALIAWRNEITRKQTEAAQ